MENDAGILFDVLAMLNARLSEIGSCPNRVGKCPNRVEKLESEVLLDVKNGLIDILLDSYKRQLSSNCGADITNMFCKAICDAVACIKAGCY